MLDHLFSATPLLLVASMKKTSFGCSSNLRITAAWSFLILMDMMPLTVYAASICADEFATRREALKKKQVKGVSLFYELTLGNLLGSPKLL